MHVLTEVLSNKLSFSQPEEDLLRIYLKESRTSNMTIAFGHYPTSLVAMQSGNSVRQLIR